LPKFKRVHRSKRATTTITLCLSVLLFCVQFNSNSNSLCVFLWTLFIDHQQLWTLHHTTLFFLDSCFDFNWLGRKKERKWINREEKNTNAFKQFFSCFNQAIFFHKLNKDDILSLTLTQRTISTFVRQLINEFWIWSIQIGSCIPTVYQPRSVRVSYLNREITQNFHLLNKIKHLSMDDDFNGYFTFSPPTITHLNFGNCYNRGVQKLPHNVTHLTFGENFQQPNNQ